MKTITVINVDIRIIEWNRNVGYVGI